MGLPTVTSSFAGKAAGFYISNALKQAQSVDFLTLIENIKFKSAVQKLNASGLVADASCDFNQPAGAAMTLTESILTPKNLEINLDICANELLSSWEALEMRAGAGAMPPASFDDYVVSYLGEIIANGVEDSIWLGDDATPGQFTGFVTGGAVGHLVAAGNATVAVANVGGAGTAYSATNIIQNLQNCTAAIPTTIYTKEDLYIYMSPKSYRLYISALSALTSFPFGSMNEDYTKVFEGIKIAVCPGQSNDVLVAAQKSNLFAGTDLLSDTTRIALLDMSAIDGSSNLRCVAKYTMGTQVGFTDECVLVS
jgi:hypothetical protein